MLCFRTAPLLMSLSLIILAPMLLWPYPVRAQAQVSSPQSLIPLPERHQNLQALRTKALALRDAHIPGVELWSQLVTAAMHPYQNQPLTAASRCDLVVQDLALVILGPYALKYLIWFETLIPQDYEDPLVRSFFEDFEPLNLPSLEEPFGLNWWKFGYAGKLDEIRDPGLDRHFAADFRPELNDHTDNQIFHCFFYQYMAYLTQAPEIIREASVYHEIADQGGSIQDHNAALVAIRIGQIWRQERDSDRAEATLQDWPGMILAAYGLAGGPALRQGLSVSPRIQHVQHEVTQMLEHPTPLEYVRRNAEYSLITLFEFLHPH